VEGVITYTYREAGRCIYAHTTQNTHITHTHTHTYTNTYTYTYTYSPVWVLTLPPLLGHRRERCPLPKSYLLRGYGYGCNTYFSIDRVVGTVYMEWV
jgi:hypothetical protein